MPLACTDDALEPVLHALADAARAPALRHFRNPELAADNKDAAGYDPVTAADRETEDAMRAVLAGLRPDDGILGEERGASEGTSGLRWVIDPIDGTRAYVIGAPTWGVLVGLRDDTGGAPRARLGAMDQPWTGDRFWGDGRSAWAARPGLDGPAGGPTDGPRRIRASGCTALADARICSTFPEVGSKAEGAAFAALAARCRLTRYGLDCTAYALLAAGCVDLVVEAGLNAYDIMPLLPIIEGAGGVVTTWAGGPALDGGRVIAAATPALHAAALELLSSV
ncbi:inositol monophosphatase family protein [Rhodovulum sp. DZ06]|uniref:inositol monophosphatase family protein n=1 Tax=Rhodovulum sp. DZ06 TaxID=3425126 RepID=UPI003D335B38